MRLNKIIIDADFCIKVGASPKYRYLEKMLPVLAEKVYVHKITYDEIMAPLSAKDQLDALISQGILEVIDETILNASEKTVYSSVYQSLAKVMIFVLKIKSGELKGFNRKETKVLLIPVVF